MSCQLTLPAMMHKKNLHLSQDVSSLTNVNPTTIATPNLVQEERRLRRKTFERGKSYSFYCLGRRMMTVGQMRAKLIEKDYSEEVADKIIAYLIENRYLDDEEYAKRYISIAFNSQKKGVQRIKQDLRLKKVDGEIIDQVILDAELNFCENLRQLVEERAVKLDLSNPKDRNRLVSYLARRGYNFGDINKAIREVQCD